MVKEALALFICTFLWASSGEALMRMRTDGVGPDSRNRSAARLGVRLCKIMAGVRGLPTHVQDYSSASRGCHVVL